MFKGRDFQVIIQCIEKKNKYLRSAALTVAVLVFFLVGVGLPTLLRLVLAGLTALLALFGLSTRLAMLPGLTALLALPVLVTLLTLLLHIVCHELPSWESADLPAPSRFIALQRLVAARCGKGWEGHSR
ncbi:MAG: hypothetical protein WAN60_04210, partial [Candidatus Sulfotelmatobacter sp.]